MKEKRFYHCPACVYLVIKDNNGDNKTNIYRCMKTMKVMQFKDLEGCDKGFYEKNYRYGKRI